ncbi:Isopenicillin N synthase-like, Fe(2+) 2OG dioxygenase domain [Dillenia turbinata]|uniref:2-oxoglutarate-dependent dioxygenase DAO n=1 Tax=Dillenia turbinata TaxID=194707 RepID=A0AAN8ZQN5_9MAGN
MMIPVIDMKKFPGQYTEMLRASQEWGCFRVVNHGIPNTLLQEMKSVVKSLFDLPLEIKRRNKDAIPGSGYQQPNEANPLYEALGLYDIASSDVVQEFCSLLCVSTHQRDVIGRYARAIHGLGMEIAGKIGESMGLGDAFCKGWASQFRINKYHFTPQSVGTTGVQIHTDSGFLTILQEDENVGGLEVMDHDSSSFVAVDPLPSSLLINFGDIATAWSNGKICNVKHRVQCKEETIRFSIATFLLGPKDDQQVEAPSELIDAQHPRLFLPFTIKDYRKLRESKEMHAGEALSLVRANATVT